MQWGVSVILFLCLSLTTVNSYSQCCSPGNPIGGTGNLGVLEEKSLKVMLTHRYSYSGKYMAGNEIDKPYFVKTGYFNHTGILLAFALNKRFTVELESGYFANKTQTYVAGIIPDKKTGYGLTNVVFTPKINLLKKNDWEITTGLGLKYPVGSYNKAFNGAVAELDIQPSTGAVDYIHTLFISKEYLPKHLRFFLYNRMEIKTANPLQYKYGNLYATSFFVSYSASFRWDLVVQIRNEIRSKDERPAQVTPYNMEKIPISGSQKVFISPLVNYNISQTMRVSLLADIPLYQYYNEQQLANSFAVALSIVKKIKTEKNGK